MLLMFQRLNDVKYSISVILSDAFLMVVEQLSHVKKYNYVEIMKLQGMEPLFLLLAEQTYLLKNLSATLPLMSYGPTQHHVATPNLNKWKVTIKEASFLGMSVEQHNSV